MCILESIRNRAVRWEPGTAQPARAHMLKRAAKVFSAACDMWMIHSHGTRMD